MVRAPPWAVPGLLITAAAGDRVLARRHHAPPRPAPSARTEREQVLGLLRGRFVDAAPAQAWATLLDEGTYLASESTMYRLLRATGESKDRRRQATHPPRTIPELVADQPNRVGATT